MKKALILSGIYWNNTYQRHQQFANYLVKADYEVIFVEHIISSKFNLNKFFKVLLGKMRNKQSVTCAKTYFPKEITLINSSFVNPMNGVFLIINVIKAKQLVKKIRRELKISEFDLVINYLPINTTRYILSNLKYKKLIYDCVRDFVNWGEACKNIEYEEKKLLTTSDYVFTDSYYLTKKIGASINNVKQFLPVVDNMWVEGCVKIRIPSEIKKLGYFGTFDMHVDTKILEQLQNLGYEIHFWGKEEVRINSRYINHGFFSNLKRLASNIIEEVDAIIIPYKGNMDGVIPAKLMQALFTQLPVYISSFYDSNVLEEFLYVYRTGEDLLLQLCNYDKESHIYKQKNIERFLSDKYEDNQYKKFKAIIN